MKRELYEDWTAALRSGNFPQGKGHLKKDGNYCCLGVLCAIADVPREYHSGLEEVAFVFNGEPYLGSLNPVRFSVPKEAPTLLSFFGMDKIKVNSKKVGMFLDDVFLDLDTVLMHINDGGKYTFSQIADALDEYVADGSLVLT